MVMFGEMLPPEPMKRAALMAHDSDAVLVIGSTLSIYPAASVVAKTARKGKPLVIVNQGPTDHDDLAAVKLDGPAGSVVSEMVRAIVGEER
jgi:NAD-dependent deacetylase